MGDSAKKASSERDICTKYITPTELASDVWLIREDAIRLGDVLLTKGGRFQSKKISKYSRGRFSHVAVFVSRLAVLESDDLVAEAWIQSIGYTLENGRQIYWALLPHAPIEAELWRHPEIDTIPNNRFKEVNDEMIRDYWGMDYSLYVRLIPLLQLPRPLKLIEPTTSLFGSSVAELYDLICEQSEVPGPFCSELVAELYRLLPLPLFREQRESKLISPIDLANSELKEVRGAILRRKDLENFNFLPKEYSEMMATGTEVETASAQAMHEERVYEKRGELSEELVRISYAQIDEVFKEGVESQAKLSHNLATIAAALPMPRLQARANRLRAEFVIVVRALLASRCKEPRDRALSDKLTKVFMTTIRSNIRLTAIAKSQHYKKEEITLKNSGYWLRWFRRRQLHSSRRKEIQNCRNALAIIN